MSLKESIENYIPFNEQEEKDKEQFLRFIDSFDDVLSRDNIFGHFSASAFVVNKERNKMVVVYHLINDGWICPGGHADGKSKKDYLYIKSGDDVKRTCLSAETVDTNNTHGTGCTLSSAIATFLGQGNSLPEAVRLAKAYMDKTIKAASQWEIGSGYGPLCHFPPDLKL